MEQTKMVNGAKRLLKAGLRVGIIASAVTLMWLIIPTDARSSRPSTPSEIEAQKEFQMKWNAAQQLAELRWDSILTASRNK